MDKYFMWIHYERLHNHNKAKHNKTVCIFLVIYCMLNNYDPLIKLDIATHALYISHMSSSAMTIQMYIVTRPNSFVQSNVNLPSVYNQGIACAQPHGADFLMFIIKTYVN